MFLFQKGQTIDNRYTVVFPHKEGAYAETYRVRDGKGHKGQVSVLDGILEELTIMNKRFALITLTICVCLVAGILSCSNERSVLRGQMVQKRQLAVRVDSVAADTLVAAGSVAVNSVAMDTLVAGDPVVATESSDFEPDCEKLHRTIYKKNGRTIYFETEDCMVCCYTQVGNKKPRKVIFGHYYGEDSFPRMYSRTYGENVFVVGDFLPNSNGWTVRFPIYRINARTFKMAFVEEAAAVHFGKDGFRIAQCRLTNPGADCTADERWVMHDTYYNGKGKKIREDKREYDYQRMEEEYGDTLVNAVRMSQYEGE